MDNIPAVANNQVLVNSAEFIKLTIYNDYSNTANVTIYTFSSAYQPETISGQTYTPLGGLLSVGAQTRDLRVTSTDTSVGLSGIDGDNIDVVLANKVKGSKLEIIRGFYDDNYVLSNTAPRFTGIVTSYNINEDYEGNNDNYTVTLNASSYKTVLENRNAGRKTNQSSWTYFNPTDTSMRNVYSIAGRSFDFGKPATATQVTRSAATAESQKTQQSIDTGTA